LGINLHSCQGGGAATRLTADQLHSSSNLDLGFGVLPRICGDSGHSSWDTPGLIPNPEVKPAHVVCCTEVRESSGTIPSCYHLPSFHEICFTKIFTKWAEAQLFKSVIIDVIAILSGSLPVWQFHCRIYISLDNLVTVFIAWFFGFISAWSIRRIRNGLSMWWQNSAKSFLLTFWEKSSPQP
jgi:hypothetical protein